MFWGSDFLGGNSHLSLVFIDRDDNGKFAVYELLIPGTLYFWQHPKIGNSKKMKIQFFPEENNSMLTSFGKKVSHVKSEDKKSKLVDNASLREKLNFFSIPYFSVIAIFFNNVLQNKKSVTQQIGVY